MFVGTTTGLYTPRSPLRRKDWLSRRAKLFRGEGTIECDVARPPRLLTSSQDGILADRRLAPEPSFSSHVYRPTVELFNGVQLNTRTLPPAISLPHSS
ncbi:hypothetical protein ANCCAN_10198 [Ancylostoma caninum]|uniref:Uncharacterized protein n=1 Tax=Ancylostoma caninum TaxID=29170 RepID=A0A368GKM5_ANCCA|nr:hypothetical protein ANCCAN_10198 [Ancylostoma caninum]